MPITREGMSRVRRRSFGTVRDVNSNLSLTGVDAFTCEGLDGCEALSSAKKASVECESEESSAADESPAEEDIFRGESYAFGMLAGINGNLSSAGVDAFTCEGLDGCEDASTTVSVEMATASASSEIGKASAADASPAEEGIFRGGFDSLEQN